MKRIADFLTNKDTFFCNWTVVLTGLWAFLIPLGKGEQIPVGILAVMGLFILIRSGRDMLRSPAVKGFLLLFALYLVPVLISMTDAVSLKYPGRVFLTGLLSGFAGLSLIFAIEKDSRTLKRITLVLAAIVLFWLVDAGIQAVFRRDLFGHTWELDHLSGPWCKKTQMGYYFGPFSAILLIAALKKNLKPLVLWILFIAASVVVLLNNCRGGWVMYGVVAAVFAWKAFIAPRKHKVAFCALLASLFVAVLLGLYAASETFRTRMDQTLLVLEGDKQSINDALTFRVPIWEAAWAGIKDHPINGHGARNFRVTGGDYWPDGYEDDEFNTSYPHQNVLEYTYGTGLIGLTGLLASFILCIRWWIAADAGHRDRALAYGLTLLALYFPLNSHKAHFSSELAVSLWMLIAIYTTAILSRSERSEA
jgi:O-antigen ligase